MYPLGHFGVALLFTAPIAAGLRPRTQTGFTSYALAAALVPDFDRHVPGLVHHGITHTFAFAAVVGLVGGVVASVAVVVSRRTSEEGFGDEFDPVRVFAFVSLGFFVGTASHVVGDLLVLLPGTKPVSPLWPFSTETYRVEFLRLGNPVRNAVFLVVGLAGHGVVSWRASPDTGRSLRTD
ncbi:metal-dependent hydrolase [Halorussus salinus]|uniref:metal-dependent hydrolase n=1 Tax=Halorussus salinus TaxID=1364935 RepID=UPI00138F7631|nr:metal-dependent hydrolase [Halorussus salinus]